MRHASKPGRYGRLLLLAALLLGIVTMHTLGHPSGGSAHGAGIGPAHMAPGPAHPASAAGAPGGAGHPSFPFHLRTDNDRAADPATAAMASNRAPAMDIRQQVTTDSARPTASGELSGPAARNAALVAEPPGRPGGLAAQPRPSTGRVPELSAPLPGGMDPMSVCVAVLGGGWAALLMVLLGAAPAVWATAVPPRLPAVFAAWPQPPPARQKALARLSVLRV
ncbi:hypothetical protein [Streptomyces orinoci]|uniref:Uncharacterized protein n=1 Tax=Streptomyces orinoci TaxID=67339 RepID=A0ABV3JZ54_STRON|nr:hypothetical protein [Streptomyces orinoci]